MRIGARPIACAVLLAVLVVAAPGASAEEIKVESLASRPGVTLPVLILKADRPAASVVLFAGGDGKLGGFRPNGTPVFGGNFLVRSRSVFLSQGLTVAVMDIPSDRRGGKSLMGFRQSPEHMQDISAVMRYLRQQAPVPVWLVGTSLGTASVAAAAIRIKQDPPGRDRADLQHRRALLPRRPPVPAPRRDQGANPARPPREGRVQAHAVQGRAAGRRRRGILA